MHGARSCRVWRELGLGETSEGPPKPRAQSAERALRAYLRLVGRIEALPMSRSLFFAARTDAAGPGPSLPPSCIPRHGAKSALAATTWPSLVHRLGWVGSVA